MIDTLTPDQISDRLGVSLSTVFAYLRQGVFPKAIKERGTRWFVPASDVAAFEAGQIKANGVFVESNIERAFSSWATKQGHMCIKLTGGDGIPDRLLLSKWGECIFLEFKTPAGTLSPQQKKCHSKLKRRGYHVHTVRSVEEAKEVVEIHKDEWKNFESMRGFD